MSRFPRALTPRERAVLDALLAALPDDGDAAEVRRAARDVEVVGGCPCGCPSIDFSTGPGPGMRVVVDAGVRGTHDGLFLFMRGDRLGGIEYVGTSDADPDELPEPALLDVERP